MLAIVSAFVVLLFGAHPLYGPYAQGVAVLLLSGTAASVLIVQKQPVLNSRPMLVFWLLAVVMPIQSALVGLVRGTFYQVGYAFAFSLMAWSLRILVIHYGVKRIISLYIIAAAIMSVLCLVFESTALFESFFINVTEEGLVRFSPFENHPNLIGHIFGLSGALAVVYLLLKSGVVRMTLAFIGITSLAFVLAASSRGGLFAALISVGLTSAVWVKDRYGLVFFKKYTLILGVVVLIAGITWSSTGDGGLYLTALLEFDSTTRGFDSGLSGRMLAWPVVLDRVFEDKGAIFWGFGFRSWDTLAEGDVPIDNSYIELIHDFGYFTAILVFTQVLWCLWKIFSERCIEQEKYLLACVVLFAVIESFVARYMLGIGNPASLLTLFIFCSFLREGANVRNSSLLAPKKALL